MASCGWACRRRCRSRRRGADGCQARLQPLSVVGNSDREAAFDKEGLRHDAGGEPVSRRRVVVGRRHSLSRDRSRAVKATRSSPHRRLRLLRRDHLECLYAQPYDFFRGDDRCRRLAGARLGSDELRHGGALKRYVEAAWPDFDWDERLSQLPRRVPAPLLGQPARQDAGAGDGGALRRRNRHGGVLPRARRMPALSPCCAGSPRRSAPMRCATTSISIASSGAIASTSSSSRFAVTRTIWARMGEIDAEDAFYAFKHVYLAAQPAAPNSTKTITRHFARGSGRWSCAISRTGWRARCC